MNVQRPVFFNKLFLYIILGKSYTLLENVYRNITMPFWQIYAIRSKLFMYNIMKNRTLNKNEKDKSNFFIDLHTYLLKSKKTQFYDIHSLLSRIKSSMVDSQNENIQSFFINTYLYKLSSSFSRTRQSMKKRTRLKSGVVRNKLRKKRIRTNNLYKIRRKRMHKSLRIFTRKYVTITNKLLKSNVLLFKNYKFLHLNKLKRTHSIRRRHLRLSYVKQLMKHYYYLLRFRLLRTVWRLIRSVMLRKILRNRKKSSLVSTRVIGYVK
jgi:hypothetical protein